MLMAQKSSGKGPLRRIARATSLPGTDQLILTYSDLFCELFKYIVAFFLFRFKLALEKIGKEQKSQDNKNHEQLYPDDQPQFPANCHTPESVVVEFKYS